MKTNIENYKKQLNSEELSKNTIIKYINDAENFERWLMDNYFNGDSAALENWQQDDHLNKDITVKYKEHLKNHYKLSTANNKIITTNKFLKFLDRDDLVVKIYKVQTTTLDDVLTQNDYVRIQRQAQQKGTDRDVLMLEVFYQTGLRVSELQYFTVEALKQGFIVADNKGKIRKVPITNSLKKAATSYIKQHKITSGAIILNQDNEPLSRYTVFRRIKRLAGQARIRKDKAFPHNLRHLFAKNWLSKNGNNVLQLADILGHESLETTRIYTKLNIDETRKTME